MKMTIAALLAALVIFSAFCPSFTVRAETLSSATEETRPETMKNPYIKDTEKYGEHYIPMYTNVNPELHLIAMQYYDFPRVLSDGDIVAIDVMNKKEMFEHTGIRSYNKVNSAVELIPTDSTVPYKLVIVRLLDRSETKKLHEKCQKTSI